MPQQIVKKRYVANKDTIIPLRNRTYTYKKDQEFEASAEDYDVYVDLGILRYADDKAEETPEPVEDKTPEPEVESEPEEATDDNTPEEEEDDEEEDDEEGSIPLPETLTELKGLKVARVRALAEQLGLDTEGNKSDLVDRVAVELFD